MSVDEVRRATLEFLGSSDENDVAYIDEELLAEYENAVETTKGDKQEDLEPPEGAPKAASAAFVRYGNSLTYDPKIPGRLHFRNGTSSHPNDPCGRLYHRWVQMTPGSTYAPFRNCGSFTGFQIVVY